MYSYSSIKPLAKKRNIVCNVTMYGPASKRIFHYYSSFYSAKETINKYAFLLVSQPLFVKQQKLLEVHGRIRLCRKLFKL